MKDEEQRRLISRQLGPAPVLRVPEDADPKAVEAFNTMVKRRAPELSDMTQEEWVKECHRRIFGKE